ncbi:MAG: Holliday junction branch migration DNA helicase RuvB [Clostridia bacterium]|nr:Holliday junction branch migration DNA helicase RuvB [Clostridia bacterium]
MEDERFISSSMNSGDNEVENTLRPKTFDDYVGQEKVKQNLKIFIEASKKRGDALDHVLLYGPPGLGKTTMSHIIANELGVPIKITSGPAIEHAGDLAAILTNLEENEVLFVDEIHALNRAVEEKLYSAMEDFAFDIVLGKGPAAKTMRITLNKFTLIGATTRVGMLTGPFRDRFGVISRLEMYTPENLAEIISRSAKILGINISPEASLELARRSRGTPRIANRLLKRIRDFAVVVGNGTIDIDIVNKGLEFLEIDSLGLDTLDRRVLKTMITKFNGGPVGLDTVSAAINEDPGTVEDVVEPYLLQLGFIARTPRGRICLKDAYDHLGYKLTENKATQLSMFDKLKDSDCEDE